MLRTKIRSAAVVVRAGCGLVREVPRAVVRDPRRMLSIKPPKFANKDDLNEDAAADPAAKYLHRVRGEEVPFVPFDVERQKKNVGKLATWQKAAMGFVVFSVGVWWALPAANYQDPRVGERFKQSMQAQTPGDARPHQRKQQ